MAQTAGVVNSTLIGLYRDTGAATYVRTAHAKGVSFSHSHSPREISSKDSAGWQEFLEGMRGATCEISFLYAEDATEGFEEFRAKLYDSTARGLVACRYSSGVVGDHAIDFNAYITGLEHNSPEQEDNVTASCSLQVTGIPTVSVLV